MVGGGRLDVREASRCVWDVLGVALGFSCGDLRWLIVRSVRIGLREATGDRRRVSDGWRRIGSGWSDYVVAAG